MQKAIIVIPCFNERHRLRPEGLDALFHATDTTLLFVDDGSRDETGALLTSIAESRPGRAEVLALGRNHGKGEAVRLGMQAALARGAGLVGFLDADLSTPAAEMVQMIVNLRGDSGCEGLLGSRVMLLGRQISRKTSRHLLGRGFATIASLALRLPVYDTQCGAKLFRATPLLHSALAKPFRSRWIFDLELLERLSPATKKDRLREYPLSEWRDVGGSKLGPWAMAKAAFELAGFWARLRLLPHA